MATNTVNQWSPYQPFNQGVGTGMAVPQFFGGADPNFGRNAPYQTPRSSTMGAQTYYTGSGMKPRGLRGVDIRGNPIGGAAGAAGGESQGDGSFAGQGIAPVSTSITPQDLYTPEQTAHATSVAAGQAFERADPFSAMKQFDRPGLSRDAGSMSLAIPGMAAGTQGAVNSLYQQPVADAMANNQFRLQGEVARGQEGLNLAQVLRQLQQNQDYERIQGMSPLMSILMGSQ